MTTRAELTAGTCGSGYLTPATPHRYRARPADDGERPVCVCGCEARHDTHRIPSPRAAREETGNE